MSWLDDLAVRLNAQGAGTLGTDIFLSSRSAPVFLASGVIQIIETGGTSPELMHNKTDGPAYIQPGAQITVRASTYQLARAKAQSAYNALFVTNTTINSKFYQWIRPTQEPFDGGIDEQGHIRVYFNVIGKRRP